MIALPPLAGLEGLLNLNHQGIDIRPTLLRVLTDQYLQASVHTADEERQFTELTLRLLDEMEIATRAAVAQRLAPHASAPRPIILQLARDVLDVAEAVLLQSPCLTPDDLSAIVAERGDLLWVFNFHTHKTYDDYPMPAPQAGAWRCVLDSEWPAFGGAAASEV